MKETTTHTPGKTACSNTSCSLCERCRMVNYEEVRTEFKAPSAQLYEKEAAHYFFYFNSQERKAG